MKKYNQLLVASICLLTLVGCQTPSVVVAPTTAEPEAKVNSVRAKGSIYSADSYRPMFEDLKAKSVGDTLTVLITEKTSASKNSDLANNRQSTNSLEVPSLLGLPANAIAPFNYSTNTKSTFKADGKADMSNAFNGSMTVTVVDRLSNGNLKIAGEKQIMINQGVEKIKISGVVNPLFMNGNTINSNQIADVRLEYSEKGPNADAQLMGWLSRFFLTVMPF